MIKERTVLILRLVSTHIVLVPALLLVSLFLHNDRLLLLSVCQTLIVIVFLAGYWEFFSLRFRIIYSLSLELSLLAVLSIKIFSTGSIGTNLYLIVPLSLILLYLLSELVRIILVVYLRDKNGFEISFPFHNGKYLITDGGNSRISRLMNYHFYAGLHKKNKTNYSMLFATDIVKISDEGKRFLPPQNEDYPVFGEKVFSPLSGVVVKAENDINDNIPNSGAYPYNTGNTIVIRSGNKYLLLGHLKMGSIRVNVGDEVVADQFLAEAGNSGYSERSHIHIQLIESETENYWKGKGVSMTFTGKNLYKNRIISIV